jgi:hypothetical protein
VDYRRYSKMASVMVLKYLRVRALILLIILPSKTQ